MNWYEYLEYNAQTGGLLWRIRPRGLFKSDPEFRRWNTRRGRSIAGCRHFAKGTKAPAYVVIKMNGTRNMCHRIIWEMHNGPIPAEMFIDHIDGNPFNNRIENLRLATTSQNAMNRGAQRNSKSGIKGVVWIKSRNKWQASVRINGRSQYLGLFDSAEEAHAAYCATASVLHGDFFRSK